MAAPASGIKNSPFIGIENLHLAKMLTDTDSGATYDGIFSFPHLIEVQIEPDNSEETLYADNKAVENANVMAKCTLTFNTASLPLEYKAELLGHSYSGGKMTVSAGDVAPYFAVMFESTKRNGKRRFCKFFKVQFSEPSETARTREASITYNTPTMTATAIYREDKKFLDQADEEADDYTASIGTGWYSSV